MAHASLVAKRDVSHHVQANVVVIVLVDVEPRVAVVVAVLVQTPVPLCVVVTVWENVLVGAHSPAKALVEMLVVVNVQQVVVGTVGVIAWALVDAVVMAHAKADVV